ncbi:MAG: nucleotide exchange factor GrpE [Patescibacteria group bacterium]|nr:nucleotide exchange factor GrpE [Patescibacteria group bacterium]
MKKKKNNQPKEFSLEELKQNIVECNKLKEEYLAGWQRERADFLNYKRDELARNNEIISYASIDLILKILPILDNLDLAEKKIPRDLINNESVKGLLQIKIQLQDILKKRGVEEIEALGQKFDPNLHEAIEEVELKNKEPNIIIEEIKKGYKFNERVIRATKVKVSR